MKELDFGEFKKTVNLADVFGNLDGQSTEVLSALRDKLKEYINGAAKELRPSDLKELQDALTDIDLKIADRKPFRELKRSLAEYGESQAAVESAQEDLNTVMAGGEVVTGMYRDETGRLVAGLLTQEQAERNLAAAQNNRLKSRRHWRNRCRVWRAGCHPTVKLPVPSSPHWKALASLLTRM